MGDKWALFWGWWEGKKTMAGGGAIVAGAVAAIWYGKLDPSTGLMIAGAGLSIGGFAAKLNRHQAELLIGLQAIAEAGADSRAGKQANAVVDIENAARQLAARRWNPERNSGGATDPNCTNLGGDAK
jgi:hypothetical protein